MIEKYKIVRISEVFYSESMSRITSIFHIENSNITIFELIIILYSCIDELCGLCVSIIDKGQYLTSNIELFTDKNVIEENAEKIIGRNNNKQELDFLIVFVMKELSNNDRKSFLIDYHLFYLQEKSSILEFNLLFKGTSKFSKSKEAIPKF